MNIEIQIERKKLLDWLQEDNDAPFKVDLHVPDVTCTCKSQVHVPDITCTSRNVTSSKGKSTSRNVTSLAEGDSKYVIGEGVEMKLPKGTKDIPSYYRNLTIVKQLNSNDDFHFKLTNGVITAIDDVDKILLFTCGDLSYLDFPKVQKTIEEYKEKGYKSKIWCKEVAYDVVKRTPNVPVSEKKIEEPITLPIALPISSSSSHSEGVSTAASGIDKGEEWQQFFNDNTPLPLRTKK